MAIKPACSILSFLKSSSRRVNLLVVFKSFDILSATFYEKKVVGFGLNFLSLLMISVGIVKIQTGFAVLCRTAVFDVPLNFRMTLPRYL